MSVAMKVIVLVVVLLLLVLVGVALWIAGPPKRTELIDSVSGAKLAQLLPSDVESGNAITTYTSFADVYGDILADIRKANHHVHILFFKYESDAVGRELGEAMADRVKDGVQARLLYDDYMCLRWKGFYRKLSRKGVQTAGFNSFKPPILHKEYYYRNHRKMIVVDGRVAYLGGINVAERYLKGLSWGCWRDTLIRIEGPAVAAVEQAFMADWHYATGQLLASPDYFPQVQSVGTLPVRIITSGPIGDGPVIMHMTATMLDNAMRYIWFESPYFIPPDEVRQAILRAARRGVDVRVLLPPRSDRGEFTQWASKSYYAEMMEAGVKIGNYQPGYLHSKMIVADDAVAVVGSCNIDYRSYLLCEEIAAVIESPEYAKKMKEIFIADEAQSRYINPDAWRRRPWFDKMKEISARRFASLL